MGYLENLYFGVCIYVQLDDFTINLKICTLIALGNFENANTDTLYFEGGLKDYKRYVVSWSGNLSFIHNITHLGKPLARHFLTSLTTFQLKKSNYGIIDSPHMFISTRMSTSYRMFNLALT